MPQQVRTLSLEEARQLINAAEKKADELGIPYNIAVVDAGGNPIKVGDVVIGALGASGGTVDQDQKVADAALEAFKKSR